MTKAVHNHRGKIVLQLSHADFLSNIELTGQTPIAPSNVEGIAEGVRKELTNNNPVNLVDPVQI